LPFPEEGSILKLPISGGGAMLLVREVFHCKPGKVRPLIEKFQAMGKLMQKAKQPTMRLMTDFTGERYWTLVAEMEVASLSEFEKMMQGSDMTEEMQKEFGKIMEGYHDLVEDGRREIFKIEG
jgi:hypothetical protein